MEDCKCPQNILLLESNIRQISIKEIKRAHKSITNNLSSFSLGNPADNPLHTMLDAASKALQKAKRENTPVELQHDCTKFRHAISIIKQRIKPNTRQIKQNGHITRTTTFKRELEKIISHHYRPDGIKFKCNWSGYDICTTEPVETVLKHMGPLRRYLKTLKNRSIQSLIVRKPEIAEALKR